PTSVQPLAALPDDATQGIYAALPGSPVLRLPELVSGLEVRPHPFSARDLDAMTARLALGRDDPRAAWPQPAPSRPTMLVVDDDPVARLTHGALGRMLGYEVRTAEGGLDALEQCRCWRPELVLMDLEMPGMDGFAATRRLRELEAEGRLPPARIVAVTGTAPGPLTPAAGLDAWLRKPIARDALQQTIDALDGWAADAQPGEGGACAGFGPSPSA
ncbi:MAG TPA: response regulator, partial [Albitalea sp.]